MVSGLILLGIFTVVCLVVAYFTGQTEKASATIEDIVEKEAQNNPCWARVAGESVAREKSVTRPIGEGASTVRSLLAKRAVIIRSGSQSYTYFLSRQELPGNSRRKNWPNTLTLIGQD